MRNATVLVAIAILSMRFDSSELSGTMSEIFLESRFRPTDERFEDPTTRRRMRVWLDAGSGERRYVAED